MHRIQKVLNQTQQTVGTGSGLVHHISDDYCCRYVKQTDYIAIIELTEDVFGGNDWIPGSFVRLLADTTLIFVGVEYIPESKIVATRMMKIVDNGVTGITCGLRTHPLHRRKGLNIKLTQWHNKLMSRLYPNMKRVRGTSYSTNIASIKLQQKSEGLIPIKRKDFIRILYGEIVYQLPNNYYKSGMTPTQFANRLNQVIDYNKCELKELNNVDKIIELIKNKYKKNQFYLDWKIFDMNLGVGDIKKYLQEELDSKRVTIVCNENESCLGMVYIDERKRLTQIHLYGIEDDNVSAILVLDKLFKQWKNTKDNLQQNKLSTCFLMIDECLNNGISMHNICLGFDNIVITEKYL
eukprot:340313_1